MQPQKQPSDKSQVFMVLACSTWVGESMKPSTAWIGSVVPENTRYKDSFIYIVDRLQFVFNKKFSLLQYFYTIECSFSWS